MEEKREKNYRLINMEDVEAREVNWLWYPYIPYGKLTIVQGDPGEGKTTFILHLAALLTKGEALGRVFMTLRLKNYFPAKAEDRKQRTLNHFLRRFWQRGSYHVMKLQKRQRREVSRRKRCGTPKKK